MIPTYHYSVAQRYVPTLQIYENTYRKASIEMINERVNQRYKWSYLCGWKHELQLFCNWLLGVTDTERRNKHEMKLSWCHLNGIIYCLTSSMCIFSFHFFFILRFVFHTFFCCCCLCLCSSQFCAIFLYSRSSKHKTWKLNKHMLNWRRLTTGGGNPNRRTVYKKLCWGKEEEKIQKIHLIWNIIKNVFKHMKWIVSVTSPFVKCGIWIKTKWMKRQRWRWR